MLERVLLDDSDSRMTLGMLGGLRVHLKHRNITVKAMAQEKAFFNATIDLMQQYGVSMEPG